MMDANVNKRYYPPIKDKKQKQNKKRSKYAVNYNYVNYEKKNNMTKPLTPSFIHRIDKIENERSMIQLGRHNESKQRQHGFKHEENNIPAKSLTITELFETTTDVAMNAHKAKTTLRAEILKTVDTALMALFTICDEEHRGAVKKNVLVKRLYCSAACKLVRQSKPLRQIVCITT